MATQRFNALTQQGTHHVGTLSSWKVKDIANGAIVTSTPVDNYTIVELDFDVDGNRTCKQLSAVTKKQYLIAAVERRYLGESLSEFYNAVGEPARIVVLEQGLRFETSAFTLNTGVTDVVKGLVAHFDPASKTYILSTVGAPHADYANASTKFIVAADDEDTALNLGKETIRLEVQ
ncbi:hypothetical protein SAMN04487895_101742 [Paenibacillus sophorae]|uniref:Uncharacterized protein n=1 Tax=Paenibacillus sophorae TaxID=1333845 RepID=A0A1H8H5A9_9BACL|nr:hypothetical protein [Paenibacillus sophorae]QWU14430.1 hypothetical protein KP014_21215 [Paenibacillus sophorae]SEN50668.1 hypothetical protein SAMN04487895_101742 [Paenibacillus sophorae]